MDGLVFVLFFSPVIISVCFILSMGSFCLAFWAGFGQEVKHAILSASDESLISYLNRMGVLQLIADPPFRTTILYPLILNTIAFSTVLSTYTLGRILHGKRGWRFFQLGSGGFRFALLQCGTWVSLAWALVVPWMAFEGWGPLNRLGLVRSPTAVQEEHGSLLVVGASLGMIAELFAVLSLMAFNPRHFVPKHNIQPPNVVKHIPMPNISTSQDQSITRSGADSFTHKDVNNHAREVASSTGVRSTRNTTSQNQSTTRSGADSFTHKDVNNHAREVASSTGVRSTRDTNQRQKYTIPNVETQTSAKINDAAIRCDQSLHGTQSENTAGTSTGDHPIRSSQTYTSRAPLTRKALDKYRELDFGKWNVYQVLGDNSSWWWMFLGLQIAIVSFSLTLIVLSEIKLQNKIIQALLLMVFTLMLATAASLTNSVGGKWRYGEEVYLLLMPFQGGPLFTAMQGLGWYLFSCSICITGLKLLSLLTEAGAFFLAPNAVTRAGVVGLLAELILAASLLVFDPNNLDHRAIELAQSREQTLRGKQLLKESELKQGSSQRPVKPLPRQQQLEEKSTRDATAPQIVSHQTRGRTKRKTNSQLSNNCRPADETSTTNLRLRRSAKSTRARSVSRTRRVSKPPRATNLVVADTQFDSSSMESSSEHKSDVEESSLLQIWEECEDESGNVYYYNTITGRSSQHYPVED